MYQPTPQTKADDDFETMVDQAIYRRSPGRWAGACIDQGLKANTLAEGEGFELPGTRKAAGSFGITDTEAASVIDGVQDTIRACWAEVCDEARL